MNSEAIRPGRLAIRLAAAAAIVSMASAAAAEQIRFQSDATDKKWSARISGELTKPKGGGPFPLVVFLHTCGGLNELNRGAIAAHASALHAAGFATFVIDSFSVRGTTGGRACGKDMALPAIRFMTDDAFNARALLTQRPDIDGNRVFLVGQSLGASAATRAAVHGLHTHSPAFNAVAAFYPSCHVPGQGGTLLSPLLILAGELDDWLPPGECIKSKDRGWLSSKEYDLVVYPGALHGFDQQKAKYRYQGHWLGYDARAATDGRKRMVEFFRKHGG